MTASASPKRKLCSQFSNLSTLTTRKALRADLRSRITDKHSDVARQADGVGVAPQTKAPMWRSPVGLARTVRCSKTRACGEHRGALNGRTLPTALPAGPKAFRSGGNPTFTRRKLLFTDQFPHVLRCGKNGAGEHDDLVIAAALSLERERAAGLRTAIPS